MFRKALNRERRCWISISRARACHAVRDHSRRRSGSGLRRIRSERERTVRTYASEPVHSISFICRIIVVFLFAAQGRTDARVHARHSRSRVLHSRAAAFPALLVSRRGAAAGARLCAVADRSVESGTKRVKVRRALLFRQNAQNPEEEPPANLFHASSVLTRIYARHSEDFDRFFYLFISANF